MFGGGQPQAQTQTVASGVSIQSSCYGNVVPVIYGQSRLTGNLLWYGDFQAIPVQSALGNGGKGGNGSSGSTSYDYKASFIFALGEGPLGGVVNVWATKRKQTFANSHFSFANGTLGQATWGYLTTNFPAAALGYSGMGYVYVSAYDLGSSAQLPNLSYEVTGIGANAISGLPDADPALVVTDVLCNPGYGVGFPTARLSSLTVFTSYCLANGLVISPIFNTQSDAASQLNTIVQSLNSEFVWSGSSLTIVPYGDESITANGHTYTAPSASLFSLTDADFLYQQGQDPVQCTRARPSDQMNAVQFEFLDRARGYNSNIVQAKNQAAIEAYGLRGEQPESMHHFCDSNAAKLAATLKLQRQSVRNVYSFTLGWRYCLLDPMDIVDITDSGLGLNQQWVRILSLQEDDNGNIAVTAEEYLGGTGGAPLYDFEPGTPYEVDYNVAPGDVSDTLIFEPPPVLLASRSFTAPQIMVGACGGPNWGGCEVWLSLDNSTYKRMPGGAGRITAPARMGVLTAILASHADPDTVNTLSVNLTESAGVLHSGTTSPAHADADAFRTLCYVGGELIAYDVATLTSANHYDLTYLRRGVHGSAIGAHSSGGKFCRLDEAIKSFDLPIAAFSYVGQVLYVKFLSYNIYGGGLQELSDVSPYTFTPVGVGATVLPPGTVTITTDVIKTADANWTTELQIGWVASQDLLFDAYEVQYSVHSANDWRTVKVDQTTLNHAVRSLPSGTAYDVRVRAVRHNTGGPYFSSWVTTTNFTIPHNTTAPNAPTGLGIYVIYRKNILSWTASTSTDTRYYNVYRGITNTFGSATLLATHSGTTYGDDALGIGLAYFYWITAVDRSGNESSPTSSVTSTTPLIYDKTSLVHDPQFQEAGLFWTLVNAGTSPVIVSYQQATIPPATANGTNAIGAVTSLAVATSNIPASSGQNYGAQSAFIEVTQGLWYRASANARATSGAVNKNAQLFINWYAVDQTLISTSNADGPQTGGQYAPADVGDLGSALDSGNGDAIVNTAQAPTGAYYARVFPCVPGGNSAAGTGVGWRFSKLRMERQTSRSKIQSASIHREHVQTAEIQTTHLDVNVVSEPANGGTISGIPLATTYQGLIAYTALDSGIAYMTACGADTTSGGSTTSYTITKNGSVVPGATWTFGGVQFSQIIGVTAGDLIVLNGKYVGGTGATVSTASFGGVLMKR
jgi:hypothetical protein